MSLSSDVLTRAMSLIPLILSLSVHEWAHAWTAAQLGDTTAKDQGRMTLNPLAHIDIVGTLALPLLGVPFGWAKPVPVEPSRFRPDVSMTRGMLLTAGAGPLSNLLLALVCALALFVGTRFALFPPDDPVARTLLGRGLLINVTLCVFNLLPIPPLDGSRIVDGLIPFEYRSMWRTGGVVMLLILALPALWLGGRIISRIHLDRVPW